MNKRITSVSYFFLHTMEIFVYIGARVARRGAMSFVEFVQHAINDGKCK